MIEADYRYLRYALMVAERAREHGDRPFGAVLVSNRGRILVEAENAKHATHDCTSHAETRLLAQASRQFPRHLLVHCTLYVNAEPCPMCAGAIFWSGVGRVVFGLSNARLRQLVGQRSEQLFEHCAEVLARGTHSVEVVGPLFEEEAAQAFREGLVLPTVLAQ
ncbi:MAG: nucleoside deaminase [Candidatus Binatia bacterium]